MLDLALLAPERLRLLRRSEYDQMVEAGLFAHERVELLHGFIVEMSPIGTQHCECVDRLAELFMTTLHGKARVRIQGSFAASDDSEPEPDLGIYPLRDYSLEHPSTALLLIEVADTSLSKDRYIKSDLYAAVGVPEYWIVDLNAELVEVRRASVGGVYTITSSHGRGERLAPVAFPQLQISVDDVLPTRR